MNLVLTPFHGHLKVQTQGVRNEQIQNGIGAAVSPAALRRGSVSAAPWELHFDAYRQKLKFTWRPFGNSNPLQQLLLKFIRPALTNNPKDLKFHNMYLKVS